MIKEVLEGMAYFVLIVVWATSAAAFTLGGLVMMLPASGINFFLSLGSVAVGATLFALLFESGLVD